MMRNRRDSVTNRVGLIEYSFENPGAGGYTGERT